MESSNPDVLMDIDVLIVGGGGCGLTSSILLADLGIESLLVERHPDTSILPKAHVLNGRTMEILHQHGLADEVYRAGAPLANAAATVWMTSLGGDGFADRRTLHRMEAFGNDADNIYHGVSAFRAGNLGQRWLEPLLRTHAEKGNPGRVLFNHEVVSFEQDNDGVTVVVRDRTGDSLRLVRARYLIAADGGKTIGPALGVEMDGMPPFIDMVTAHLRVDLSPYIGADDTVITSILNTDGGNLGVAGVLKMGPTRWDRTSEEWALLVGLPIGAAAAEDMTDDFIVAKALETVKLPDIAHDVLMVSHWNVESVVAKKYRFDRVFLAGDAAHRHPPTTGLGLNTAIQDVHNLTWKLAAVLKGHAEDVLLDSYETERMAVGRRNVDWATLAFFNRIATLGSLGLVPGAPAEHNQAAIAALFAETTDGAARRALVGEFFETQRMEFSAREIDFGFDYCDGAIVADGSPPPPTDPMGVEHVQTARPGRRLPHAALQRGGELISTHHLMRPGAFLLLSRADGPAWTVAAEAAEARLGITVDAYQIDGDDALTDPSRAWAAVSGVAADGAVLVRPDGHVCFRSSGASTDPGETLTTAIAQVLGRAHH